MTNPFAQPYVLIIALLMTALAVALIIAVPGKAAFIFAIITTGGLAGKAAVSMKSLAPNTSIGLLALSIASLLAPFILLDVTIFVDMAIEGVVSGIGGAFLATMDEALIRSNSIRGIQTADPPA